MATVTKDFRIKSGLVVEGTNATVDGSDIITEDALTGGTQSNITVSYNPSTKAVDFSVEALSIDTNGPLSYTNEVLDLITSDGLTIDTANNGLKVALYENAGIPASGLKFNSGALAVNAGDGLIVGTTGELQAKLAPTSGLMIDTASNLGLKVNTGDTTTITNDQVEVLYGNGLTVSSPFGLVVDTDVIASRSYVDAAVSGLTWKPAVNLFADVNVDISSPVSWPATPGIDGHAQPTEAYRILLTAQTTDSENGIWVYTPATSIPPAPASWTRAEDADDYTELDGAAVFVMEGNQYGSTSWVQSNHYLTGFGDQEWDQFSGQGTFTAGNGLSLLGNEFSINDTIVVTHDDLDGYLNSTDGTTYVALTDYADTLVETGDPTATPTYLALDINSVAKQVAASATTDGLGTDYVVYEFLCSNEYGNTEYYRSAKFLVKMASGTHTQVSEILLTLDSSDNLAITEYAIVGTNGNLGNVSAKVFGAASSFPDKIQLTVNSASVLNVKVAGTLLV